MKYLFLWRDSYSYREKHKVVAGYCDDAVTKISNVPVTSDGVLAQPVFFANKFYELKTNKLSSFTKFLRIWSDVEPLKSLTFLHKALLFSFFFF